MELSKRLEKNCNKLIFDCSDEELFAGILKTIDELKETYYKYEKEYKNDKRFMNAVNQRNKELEKQAA